MVHSNYHVQIYMQIFLLQNVIKYLDEVEFKFYENKNKLHRMYNMKQLRSNNTSS